MIKPQDDHNYPLAINYFCKIHNTEETAEFIGVQEGFGNIKEQALYNTPQGHTLPKSDLDKIVDGTWPKERWDQYVDSKPLD